MNLRRKIFPRRHPKHRTPISRLPKALYSHPQSLWPPVRRQNHVDDVHGCRASITRWADRQIKNTLTDRLRGLIRRSASNYDPMPKVSPLFALFRPGMSGRRATRHLDPARVQAAVAKSRDPAHNLKFLSGPKRRESRAALDNQSSPPVRPSREADPVETRIPTRAELRGETP